MSTLDEIFYSEFMSTMQYKRGLVNIRVEDIIIPQDIIKPIPTMDEIIIKGVKEPYYKSLNFNEGQVDNAPSRQRVSATLIGRVKLRKKLFMPDGSIRKDEDGKIMYEDVITPNNCASILSSVNIHVPKAFEPMENFSYVDFRVSSTSPNNIRYIYIIPKKYIYVLNICALTLSLNRLKNSYFTLKVTLINGVNVYLQVVPFKPTHRIAKPYIIIKTKANTNFNTEIESILSFWENNGIMFNRNLTRFQEPVRGLLNCAVVRLDPTLTDYTMYDKENSLDRSLDYI